MSKRPVIPTESINGLINTLIAKMGSDLTVAAARYELLCAMQEVAQTCAVTWNMQLTTQGEVSDYFFDDHIPECQISAGLEYVKYCGVCLDPIDPCEPCPEGYEVLTPTAIRLHPTPRQDSEVQIGVTLMPEDGSVEVPKVYIERYSKQILDRAMGELMMYPGRNYSDPRQARVHLRRAEASRINAAVSQSRGYDRRPSCVGEQVL